MIFSSNHLQRPNTFDINDPFPYRFVLERMEDGEWKGKSFGNLIDFEELVGI